MASSDRRPTRRWESAWPPSFRGSTRSLRTTRRIARRWRRPSSIRTPKSTLLLGQARGAAMAGLSMAGLQVDEYAARKVKQCIVGHGAADKDQIGFMIARLLPKAGKMNEDAADALAVAITHANNLPAQGRIKKAASHSMIMNTGTIQTGKSGKKASA